MSIEIKNTNDILVQARFPLWADLSFSELGCKYNLNLDLSKSISHKKIFYKNQNTTNCKSSPETLKFELPKLNSVFLIR